MKVINSSELRQDSAAFLQSAAKFLHSSTSFWMSSKVDAHDSGLERVTGDAEMEELECDEVMLPPGRSIKQNDIFDSIDVHSEIQSSILLLEGDELEC